MVGSPWDHPADQPRPSPAAATVTITDTVPYDVEARLEWSATGGQLAVRSVRCTALPGGDGVSPAGIARIALRELVPTAPESDYLGGPGWPG